MPLTISNFTGDGTTAARIDCYLQLPDSGTTVTIAGSVQAVGQSQAAITGSPLAMPTAPATGQTFWNVQVDTGTGAATVQQSPTSDPALISGTSVEVFQQILSPTSTDPALAGGATPNDS